MNPDLIGAIVIWFSAATITALVIGSLLHDDRTPYLTREPDLFEEQAALYGPAAMYGPLPAIDAGDPFAGWSREEFDRLCDDPPMWRTFEEIQGCSGIGEEQR